MSDDVHDPYLRAVPVPAFVVDGDGRVAAWNDAATECFGWREAEVLGDGPPCVPSVQRGRWRTALETALAQGELERTEFSLRAVDGRRVEASVSMASVDGTDLFVCIEDHTEHSALSQELRLYNRVLRHNLRNDLNLVTGYADELAADVDDADERRLVDGIREHAESVLALAETARDLDAALGESKPLQSVQLDALVEAATAEFADAHESGLSLDLQRVRARATGDLELAVRHLVDNAIAHNDATESRVEVSTRETVVDGRRWATLVVADNGPGIPRAEREVLTQGSETALQHGSGLGLWLVYWVVRQCNGELAYESVDPRGSKVTLRLLADDAGGG